MSDPYVEEPPWHLPWPGDGLTSVSAPAPTPTGNWSTGTPAFAVATAKAFAAGPLRRRWHLLEILPNPLINKAPVIFAPTVAGTRSRETTRGEGEAPDDAPESLPVDANWYFFLFVCECSLYGVLNEETSEKKNLTASFPLSPL